MSARFGELGFFQLTTYPGSGTAATDTFTRTGFRNQFGVSRCQENVTFMETAAWYTAELGPSSSKVIACGEDGFGAKDSCYFSVLLIFTVVKAKPDVLADAAN